MNFINSVKKTQSPHLVVKKTILFRQTNANCLVTMLISIHALYSLFSDEALSTKWANGWFSAKNSPKSV